MAAACVYLAAKVEERQNVKLSMIVVVYLKFMGLLPPEVDPEKYTSSAVRRRRGSFYTAVCLWGSVA